METLYNVKDAANILHISTSFLYKKAEDGTIGCIKIGSALRFSKNNIDEYLKKCNKEPIISKP
jgi:excisionase family DNA binding protein